MIYIFGLCFQLFISIFNTLNSCPIQELGAQESLHQLDDVLNVEESSLKSKKW